MRHWRYKAYNSEFLLCEGVAAAQHFSELAVKLRQGGLQIVEATTISQDIYIAELRKIHQQNRLAKINGKTTRL